MKAWVDNTWRDDFLDAWRPATSYRLQPIAVRTLTGVEGLYFIRPRSFWLLAGYLREIGLRSVVRKVRSRLSERRRNAKYLSIGYGRILEGPDAGLSSGDHVFFIATCHPQLTERFVIDQRLVWRAAPGLLAEADGAAIRYVDIQAPDVEEAIAKYAGWQPESGQFVRIDDESRAAVERLLTETEWSSGRKLAVTTGVQTNRGERRQLPPNAKPNAVLFGYGNYAKTVILPNIASSLALECVHEIDPMQIPTNGRHVRWSTTPVPVDDDQYAAFLIAGYHHTHADLAIHALDGGVAAVVEKPIVVDRQQLNRLLESAGAGRAPFFACFHKRYSPMNEWARTDLGLEGDEPVNYHCIVYEVPLPLRHWYRWPNSHSRIVSNGCHWIDHFLFLNGYPQVRKKSLVVMSDETINCSMELENGAVFTMALTDSGSERIGLQEYTELRAQNRTVKMQNGGLYIAEGPSRIIRRRRINKMRSYRNMYRTIASKIARGEAGDSTASIRSSSEVMLAFEHLRSANQWRVK